ncbi:phage tail protein [Fimbriiglobus ruber]|uniref:phage tail protein n=1 Tax=Fimbriiglobus ruber TaxID=1908690 RepID=UPI0021BCC14F|nr:phage tail protein [Fimbriiglobus ruber]
MSGSITVSSATYPVSEWSASVSNDGQDVTDTGSSGWVARIAGVNSAELTFKAFWGSATAELTTAFAIGTVVAATLTIGNSSETFIGNFLITSVEVTNNCKTPVEFSCTGESTGAITMPA